MDIEDMTIEQLVGGVAAPRGVWRQNNAGWSDLTDPRSRYEAPKRHKPGDPDEPGYLELWWATNCVTGRD